MQNASPRLHIFRPVIAATVLISAAVAGAAFAECDEDQEATVGKAIAIAATARVSPAVAVQGKQMVNIDVCDMSAGTVVVTYKFNFLGADGLYWVQGSAKVKGAGGGWRTDQPEQLPALGMHELAHLERGQVGGGSLTVEGHSIIGRAGPGVAVVRVEVPGVPVMTATLQNGWFAAWWPFEIPDRQFGDPRPPEPVVIVRAYDLLGNLLSEARP